MERFLKANKFRTNLLIKISSEIKKFINSPILINSVSPKNLYDSYSNIEITINNEFEFEVSQTKENQKDFQISPKTKIENEIPYMEIFKKINKIIISDKKNKTFYDKLDSVYTNDKKKNIQDTNDSLKTNYNTPKKILYNNNNEDQTYISIKFLRNYSRTLKLNCVKITKCHRKNESYIPKSTINFIKEYKNIDNPIIENDPDFYSSSIPYGLHDDFSSNKLQNKKCNNIIRNKRCKISFNCSTFNHQKCMKTIFTPYGNL